MRYENEKCPLCGNVFTEDDDVVVCPQCATPHHRECYLENGRCANEEKHQEGFVWTKTEVKVEENKEEDAQQEEKDYIVCPECGTKNKKNALVCSNCASVLNPEIREQFEPPKSSGIYIDGKPVNNEDCIDEEGTVTVKEAVCFIQRGKESYIKTFLDAKFNKRKPKFNIWAFLFGAYWFFYRKMYKPGFAFLGVNFALKIFNSGLVLKTFPDVIDFFMRNANAFAQGTASIDLYEEYYNIVDKSIQSSGVMLYVILAVNLASIVVNIVAGLKANGFYLNFIKESVVKIKKALPHPGAYYTYLYAKGGTSFLTPALISMAIYYLNEIIFSYAMR